MKNKLLISLLFISGLLLSTESFAINEVSNETSEVTQNEGEDKSSNIKEAEITKEDITNEENVFVDSIEYDNNIHSDFSLDDCIKIAIKNNLVIQSSVINESIYKEKIGIEWSNYFPELGAGVSWARNRMREVGSYNTAYLPNVSANMTVFDFGKTKASADSAKKVYESKTFDTQESINLLICNIKKAYYNLLFAQAQYDVYTDTVKDFELQKKQAFSLYTAGKKAKVDVAIADYNLCKAKLNFEKAKNVLKVAKYELSYLMGFPEYSNYTLSSKLGNDLYTINLDEALDNAYKVRPLLLSATKSHEAAKLNLRARKRDFTPNIKINANFGNDVGNYAYSSLGFGANLEYSNFNIMKTKKKINEARYTYEKSQVDLEEVKHDLYLSVNKAYENFYTAKESIGIAAVALEQAQEQYRQTKGRYKAGIADIIELKDGENAFLNARLDYYNSLLNYNVSIAEFEKEIGGSLNSYISTQKKTN